MKVYNKLGNGFQEKIYHRALAMEMIKSGLQFIPEYEIAVYYDTVEIGKRKVDFMVEKKILVELKAIADLEKRNITQTMNYLEASKKEVGLLLNFGSTSLQFHRFKLKESKSNQSDTNNPPINPI